METAENFFIRLMTMTDEVWDRHANPWSVWTRVVAGLPLLLGAFWAIRLRIAAVTCVPGSKAKDLNEQCLSKPMKSLCKMSSCFTTSAFD